MLIGHHDVVIDANKVCTILGSWCPTPAVARGANFSCCAWCLSIKQQPRAETLKSAVDHPSTDACMDTQQRNASTTSTDVAHARERQTLPARSCPAAQSITHSYDNVLQEVNMMASVAALSGSGASSPVSWSSPVPCHVHQIMVSTPRQLQQGQTAIQQHQPVMDDSSWSVALANTAAPGTPGAPYQGSLQRFEQHWQSMQQQQQQSQPTLSHASMRNAGMPAPAGTSPSDAAFLDSNQPGSAPLPGAYLPTGDTTDGSAVPRQHLHAVQGSPTVVHLMPSTAQMSGQAHTAEFGCEPDRSHWSHQVHQTHAASNQHLQDDAAAPHLPHQQARPGGAALPVGVVPPPAMSDTGPAVCADDRSSSSRTSAACSAPFSMVTPTYTTAVPLLPIHPTAASQGTVFPTGASPIPHPCHSSDSTQATPAGAAPPATPTAWIAPEQLPGSVSHSAAVQHDAAWPIHSPNMLAAPPVKHPVSSTTHWNLSGPVPASGHTHAVLPGMGHALPPQQTGSSATFGGTADRQYPQQAAPQPLEAAHQAGSSASSAGPTPLMGASVLYASHTGQQWEQQEFPTQHQQQHQHHLWQQHQPQQQPTVLSSPHQPAAYVISDGVAPLQNRAAGSFFPPAHQHGTPPFLPGIWQQQQHTAAALLSQVQTGQPQLVHVPLQLYAAQGAQMGLPAPVQGPNLQMMPGLVPLGGQVAFWPSPAANHPSLLQMPQQHTTAAVVQGVPVWPGQHALYPPPLVHPGTGFPAAAYAQLAGLNNSSSSLQTSIELQGRAPAAAESPAAMAGFDNIPVRGNGISDTMRSDSTTTTPAAAEAAGHTVAAVATAAGEVGFALHRHPTAAGSSNRRASWLLQMLLRLPSGGGTNSTSTPPSEQQCLDMGAAAQLSLLTNPTDLHTITGPQSGQVVHTMANLQHYVTLPAVRAMAFAAQAPSLVIRGVWCIGSTAVWTSAASAHMVALGALTICEYQLLLLLVWLTLTAAAARAAYAAALMATSAARVGALLVTRETRLFVRAASVVATQDMRTLCVQLAIQPLALAMQEITLSQQPHGDSQLGATHPTATAGAVALVTAGSTASRSPSAETAVPTSGAVNANPAHLAIHQHSTAHVQVGPLQPTLSITGWSRLLHSWSGRSATVISHSVVAVAGASGSCSKPAASLSSPPSMSASTSRRSSMDHGNAATAGGNRQKVTRDGQHTMASPFAAVLQQAVTNSVSNVPAAAVARASTGRRVSLEETKTSHSTSRRVSRDLTTSHTSLLPFGRARSVLPAWGYSNPLRRVAVEPGGDKGGVQDPGSSTRSQEGDFGVPAPVLLVYDSLAVVSGLWAGLWVKLGLLVLVQGPLSASSIWWQAVLTGCCMSASAAATSAHTAMQAAWYLAHASLAVLGSVRTAAVAAGGAYTAGRRASIDNPAATSAAAAGTRSSGDGCSRRRAADAWGTGVTWSAVVGIGRPLSWLRVQTMKGMQGMLAAAAAFLPGGAALFAVLRSISDCTSAAWKGSWTVVKGVWSWLVSAQHGLGGLWRLGGFKACALSVAHLMGGLFVQLALWWLRGVEHCAVLVMERVLQDAPPVARTAVYGSARMIRGLAVEACRQSGCLALQLLEVWMAR